MPELELQVSNAELEELRGRANAAALDLRDFIRDRLSLPDEQASQKQQGEEAAEAFRIMIDSHRRMLDAY